MGICGVLLSLAVMHSAPGKDPRNKPKEIFTLHSSVVQNQEYAKRFWASTTLSFDVSPDGTTLAALLNTFEEGKRHGVWVALWNIDTQQLETVKRLAGPGEQVFSSAQHLSQLRFAPDGNKLLILAGPRMIALEFPNLREVFSVEAPIPSKWPWKEEFIYKFSVARDAPNVTLLFVVHRVFSQSFELRTLNLETGETIKSCRGQNQPTSLALSGDGKQVAVSTRDPETFGTHREVYVFAVSTCEILRTLDTTYITNDVLFFSDRNQLLTIAFGGTAPKDFRTDTIKFWELAAGELVQELDYGKYGLRGKFSLSRSGSRLAAITSYCSPLSIRLDTCWGFTRYLIWDLPQGRLLYTSPKYKDKPLGIMGVEDDFLFRFSADGTRFAVGGEPIRVFSLLHKKP